MLCGLAGAQERELLALEGRITIQGHLAAIDLPEGWTYHEGADARYVVEDLWGSPEDPSVLGLALPPEDGADYGVVVSYDEEGHIDDSDAGSIDYDELLETMQQDARDWSDEREAAGYGRVEVLGWAEAPLYDAVAKKLYWAKNLRFDTGRTLNYDVRILGREGTLILSAVAADGDVAQVAAGCKELLAATSFLPGNTYAEYDPKADRLAAYGIGGLIAGKVLAKAGLFKAIGLFLAKAWKPIALAVVALGAVLRRMLGRGEPGLEPAPGEDEVA